MSPPSRLPRRAPCPCGRGRALAACCLPWEAAFRQLVSRLIAFAETPRVRRMAARAAALFWNVEEPLPAEGMPAASLAHLPFLEWFLNDYAPTGGGGPLLGDFADGAVGLPPREEALLFAMLLAPVRAYEVTEAPGPRGIAVKDLLAGAESRLGPLGLPPFPIQSDLVVCRLLPLGHLVRPGLGLLRLPAGSREELLAYLRTAYRMARPARHISLEDFLDGSTHLYHHFFLLRGRALGGQAQATLRAAAFAPGGMAYRTAEVARVRAALDRQPELEREGGEAQGVRYVWIDLEGGLPLAAVRLGSGKLEVYAQTQADLAAAACFLEGCLRGLIQPAGATGGEPAVPRETAVPATKGRPSGSVFLRCVLERWPDTPLPLLGDRTPRQACRSRAGREEVASLLLGLERDLARSKRLGRAWADVGPLREALALGPAASASTGSRGPGAGRGRLRSGSQGG